VVTYIARDVINTFEIVFIISHPFIYIDSTFCNSYCTWLPYQISFNFYFDYSLLNAFFSFDL